MNVLWTRQARQAKTATGPDIRRRVPMGPVATPAEIVRTAALRLATARGTDFQRALDALLEALGHPQAQRDHDASVLLDAERLVSGYFAKESSAAMAHEIVWGDEDQAFADWAIRARERWAGVALAFAKLELSAIGAASPLAPRLLAMAMSSLGEAIKWRAIAGRSARDLQTLHETWRTAESSGLARTAAGVVQDGAAASTTPEALYIRALLFDALCAGALSRQEMVIADGWLLLWSAGFRIEIEPPGDKCPVAIGIRGAGGLEPCSRAAGTATRYLAGLAGLRSRIEEVRAAFHEGRIVAGTRFAATLAIEHHVSALGRLEELLAYWANPAATREKRLRSAEGAVVPLFVGLGDVLDRGFGPVVDTAPAAGAQPCAAAAMDVSRSSDRHMTYGMVLEPLGMRATLVDRSVRGLGIAVPRREQGIPSMGDLVGVRDGEMLRVGRVVRRFADPASNHLRVGIRVLTDDPARVALVAAAPGMPKAAAEVIALFVPGSDLDGRFDAMLVSRATFQAGGPFEMTLGTTTYTIRFSRDQVSGRGWVAARFEVLAARET